MLHSTLRMNTMNPTGTEKTDPASLLSVCSVCLGQVTSRNPSRWDTPALRLRML